jgi:hypothetical protein
MPTHGPYLDLNRQPLTRRPERLTDAVLASSILTNIAMLMKNFARRRSELWRLLALRGKRSNRC